MIGQTLSHYKIIEKLGQGGQGEVYLAEDSRLDRKVALKILPQHLSDRADLRERFEREARAVSSLNHPHICTLHDIGEQDGIHYLVMEHLVGETLEARLAKGPLPLEQTLEFAIQIADALDKAHRQGVVHRDLKPGNIMLVKSGAKLLDFGLAKLQAADTPTNLSALPTEQANLTAEGTILGTLQYMAPEQLEGKEADSRTDIFAFGAVVSEMATGKKAFEGSSQASLIAAIMGQDPRPMSELQPMTPSTLDHIVRRCMAKEPDERWQSSSDVMRELKWISESVPSANVSGLMVGRPKHLSWGLIGSLAGALLAGFLVWNLTDSSPVGSASVTRLVVALPGDHQLAAPSRSNPIALSPDGTRIVYVDNSDGRVRLYLRALDGFEATPIAGTEAAQAPFFSPDGRWVGFFSNGKLQKVSVEGGAPLPLCDAPFPSFGASWGPDDTIIFSGTGTFGLIRIPAGGGITETLTTPDTKKSEFSHLSPQILPGGTHVLFTVATTEGSSIAVLALETREWRVLLPGAAGARYLPTGHLVYAQAGGLWAVPLALERLELTGTPISILDGVYSQGWVGVNTVSFSVSDTGVLAYVPGDTEVTESPVWVDRTGKASPLTEDKGEYVHPRLSPDGKQLAIAKRTGVANYDIWVYDTERGSRTRLTVEGNNYDSAWTPDGSRLTFNSTRAGQGLYEKPADGSGLAQPLLIREHYQNLGSWSLDGQTLAFTEQHPITGTDIWVLTRDGDRVPSPVLATSFHETAPVFSPDGGWLAYVSDESGRNEVYVLPYPSLAGKTPISTDGGVEPAWSADGRELFYRNGYQMLAVPVETGPTFSAEKPELLFEERYKLAPIPIAGYDVSPDGERFLMIREDKKDAGQINVVLNWFEELKRLVPTDN